MSDPFQGFGLRPVQLADQDRLTSYFASLTQPLSDYTFSQLYTWRNSLRILWRELDGHLCVFANGAGDLTLLLPPVGDTGGDRALSHAFELMDEYNSRQGVPNRSRVEYASEELISRFDRRRFPAAPMGFDYVYDVAKMIDLPGGDFASKRQGKNRFMRNYEYQVETYDPARHREACHALLGEWRTHQDAHDSNDVADDNVDTPAIQAKRLQESKAADLCLECAGELGLPGMVVRVKDAAAGGEFAVKGFTFGEPLGADQSSITIEKTDLAVKGLAQFIFSEFCRTQWASRPLVNVGDDWGLETLAWTKMSYRPVRLLQKYVLRHAPALAVAGSNGSSPVATENSVVESLPPMPPMQGKIPMPVRVRLADKSDLAAAVELEKACFSPSVSLKKRQLQYLQQRRSAVFLVAEQGDSIVGEGIALVRQHRSGLSGRIYSLAVGAEARGQKIGQRLLAAMLDALAERSVRRVYLEVEQVNAAAIRLYELAGFRRIGTLPDYYGPARHGSHMTLEISVPREVESAANA